MSFAGIVETICGRLENLVVIESKEYATDVRYDVETAAGSRHSFQLCAGESGQVARAVAFHEAEGGGEHWISQPAVIEAMLLCRLPASVGAPMVASMLPNGTLQFETYLVEDEAAVDHFLALADFAFTFFETAKALVYEGAPDETIVARLRAEDYAAETLWTAGSWRRIQRAHSDAFEYCSDSGRLCRILPAGHLLPGFAAISLGNATPWMTPDSCTLLLRMNALTFYQSQWFVGCDDRGGMQLLAFLPPGSDEEAWQSYLPLAESASELLETLARETQQVAFDAAFADQPPPEMVVFT